MKTYTAIEAARELGVSEKTIRRWIEDGKLQARKLSNNWLAIPEIEIARLQLEREQENAGKPILSEQDQAALVARLADLERVNNDLVERVARLERVYIALEASSISIDTSGEQPKKKRH